MQKPVVTDWLSCFMVNVLPKTTIIIHSTSILLNKPNSTQII